MSRTYHHRNQKVIKGGVDFGARYNCDRGYCAGTGPYPKHLARRERRNESKKFILNALREAFGKEYWRSYCGLSKNFYTGR